MMSESTTATQAKMFAADDVFEQTSLSLARNVGTKIDKLYCWEWMAILKAPYYNPRAFLFTNHDSAAQNKIALPQSMAYQIREMDAIQQNS